MIIQILIAAYLIFGFFWSREWHIECISMYAPLHSKIILFVGNWFLWPIMIPYALSYWWRYRWWLEFTNDLKRKWGFNPVFSSWEWDRDSDIPLRIYLQVIAIRLIGGIITI